jgi:hypothetical protein
MFLVCGSLGMDTMVSFRLVPFQTPGWREANRVMCLAHGHLKIVCGSGKI